MKITCPGCGFERTMDETALPSAAVVATCPRCKERFRFRALPEEERISRNDDAAAGDTPDGVLPPGAVVPPKKRDLEDEELFAHPRDTPRGSSTARGREEDESRRQAAEAYRRTAELPPSHNDDEEMDNPWENPVDGYLAALYQTAVRVMFAAPRFFAGLRPQRRMLRPIMFYLIIGLVRILAQRFWMAVFVAFLASATDSDQQLGKLVGLFPMETGLPLLILENTALVSLELFVAAVLYYVMFRLVAPGKAEFSLIFQVLSYAAAPLLFNVVPVLGLFVGAVWSIACGIIGCRYALRVSWAQTAVALAPLYALIMFVLSRGVMDVLQGLSLS